MIITHYLLSVSYSLFKQVTVKNSVQSLFYINCCQFSVDSTLNVLSKILEIKTHGTRYYSRIFVDQIQNKLSDEMISVEKAVEILLVDTNLCPVHKIKTS